MNAARNSRSEIFAKQINGCAVCKLAGKGLQKVRQELQTVKFQCKAWYLVGMDTIGPMKETSKRGHQYILTLIDYYTKWPEAIPLTAKDGTTVARALYEHVYCRIGAPHRIITDNGGEFINKVRYV